MTWKSFSDTNCQAQSLKASSLLVIDKFIITRSWFSCFLMMLSPPTATFFKSRFHFTVTDCLWCGGPWLTGGGGWHITEAVAQQPCAVARARASHEVCPPCPLSPLPATNIEPIRNIQSRVNRDHPTDIIGGAAVSGLTLMQPLYV